MENNQNDLQRYRKNIDEIDHKIIELLQQRFDVVTGVAEYKQRKGLPILDEQREKEKLAALGALCETGKREYIDEILQQIMAQSRRYQADHPLRYGLLGRTLGHSHSPRIHRMLGGYDYGLFEREPEQLDAFFADKTWQGISVTMPYKRDVMPYCDELSETAIACNSVNTIVRREDGTLYGTNTDYDGFRYVVEQSGIDVRSKKTLVLGSGGVSGTVVQVLRDLGADPVTIISRTGDDNYENLERHGDARILVNTTPVGMYPKAGQAALDIRRFPQLEAVYDLIYNPLRTKLMLDAEKDGIPAFGGLPMLVAQAAKAVDLFGKKLCMDIPDACGELQHEQENIVLIGMPGSGKTTVGKALADKMGMSFVDIDDAITAWMGRTPEEIIRKNGTEAFRDVENQVLQMVLRKRMIPMPHPDHDTEKDDAAQYPQILCVEGPMVIATGGGCVERDENRELIRENGRVIWLKRALADLPLDGRPVSQSEGLGTIFRRREPAYRSWSDLQIECRRVEESVAAILSNNHQS